ncbi:hypothetical protein JG688_00015343 [Phytophthora aleatoria]|uniref:Uncharacterized protein n=1 Tax=Phytophthora aleatoria TaxID=2496075 RepID=A0A8J5M2R4_9STRA|nr:hypothetical protein JG688_00015343 [Phytophthora aleatoria]
MRQAQYLVTRTVNAFGSAHEWPPSRMVCALLDHVILCHLSLFSIFSAWFHRLFTEVETR